jgi:hypothetical protein
VQLNAAPHPPQLAASLLVSVSQPSRTTFSAALQSLQPPVQLMVHCPPRQVGVPWLVLQGVPHAPQFASSVLVLVSHPSRLKFSLALQSAYPESHAIVHCPAEQVGVPLALLQAPPHVPQLAVSACKLISQPLPKLPSQLAKPALQVYSQAPSEHPVAVMFVGASAAQLVPQFPQLARSVLTLVSHPSARPPLQSAKPAVHA